MSTFRTPTRGSTTGSTGLPRAMAGAPKPPTTPSRYLMPDHPNVNKNVDRWILIHVLAIAFKVDPTMIGRHTVYRACLNNGIHGFYSDLVFMPAEVLRSLKVMQLQHDTGTYAVLPLPPTTVARLISIVYFYHDKSYAQQGYYDMRQMDGKEYYNWLASTYDSGAALIPWYRRLMKDKTDVIFSWKKAVRLDPKSFKPLKNAYDFFHWWKEHKIKLNAYDLGHFLIKDFVVVDVELDQSQRNWMMNVLVDIIICSQGRSILLRHRDALAVREFYFEFEITLSKSMSSEFRASKITTYLTSVRLVMGHYRGTHEQFILNFQEQVRLLELITGKDVPNSMKIQFLDNAVVDVPHLCNVMTVDKTCRKAAGNTEELTFDEAIDKMVSAAQSHDEGTQGRRRPRYSRSANIHQLDDDGNEIEDDDEYEVNIHDAHTQVEDLLAFMATGKAPFQPKGKNGKNKFGPAGAPGKGPEKDVKQARLPPGKWHNLSQKGKLVWDNMPEDDKHVIVQVNTHDVEPNDEREAHKHDIADTTGDSKDEDTDNGREASMHDLLWPDSKKQVGSKTKSEDPKKKASLKDSDGPKNTNRRKLAADSSKGVDLRALLSQSNVVKPKFSATTHEFITASTAEDEDNDDGGYECRMHSIYASGKKKRSNHQIEVGEDYVITAGQVF